jgi:hypothetical protein
MTDSTLILPPGERILDASGNPVSGGTLYFYTAGTTTPLTVYSNSGLTVSLGTSVATDSGGYPSASSVRTLIYTGTAAYKIVCQDALAATLWTHDNIRGALDTSIFITSAASVVTYTVSSVSTGGTWVVADVTGKVFAADPSSASFTRTLPTAASSIGVPFDVKHVGSANIVTLLAQGADKIIVNGTDTARKALLLRAKGDSVRLISDGADFQAFFSAAQFGPRDFAVEDLRTAPAGSPVTGGFYLLNGAPSGAFTSTTPACAANDVVMYDGQSNYQIFRPFTDCGWTAFDKATNTEYIYRDTGWVALSTRALEGVVAALGYTPQRGITIGTEVATTSGTSIDFTGIPAGVKRVTVMFDGVSTSGTSTPIIQLGDSGGVETAGYVSSGVRLVTSGVNTGDFTTGFGVYDNTQWLAANTLYGSFVFSLEDSANNVWAGSFVGRASSTLACLGAGTKATSAVLDRVRITTVVGTDTFDAGAVNISYEF